MSPLNPYRRKDLGPCPTCGAVVNDAREHERHHALSMNAAVRSSAGPM